MDRTVCSRCGFAFPRSSVVLCKDTSVPGGLYLCGACHRVIHPVCEANKSGKGYTVCCLCNRLNASLYCPVCTAYAGYEDYGATFCMSCHLSYHTLHKEMHRDHVVPLNPR